MDPKTDLQQLENLLSLFLTPDNATRKQAEGVIRQLARDPSIVPALLHVVRNSPSLGSRQLAAVILRKKISGHWMKLSPEIKESLKSSLLESVAVEQSALVRRASADVVSVIAKHTVPSGEWPALLQFLLQCSQSPQEEHREVALILFSSLTETIGDILRPHFSTLHSVFVSGLQDEHSNKVRIAALKAVGALLEYVESDQEVAMFRDLIPPMLSVARFSLSLGEESVAVTTCEILDEFLELPSSSLSPSLPPIVHFSLELTANPQLELTTRHQAVELIAWMARWKPKALVKQKLVPPILNILCPLLSSSPHEYNNNNNNNNNNSVGNDGNSSVFSVEEDLSVSKFVAQVIDSMALGLPKKHIFPPILCFSRENVSSGDPKKREAALMALAATTEGCKDLVRKNLKDVLSLILPFTIDGAQEVRGASCFALGQLAEYVQPEMSEHFEQVLPAIFAVLDDNSSVVQEKACYALAAFCENLGTEILPYMEPLMKMLLKSLQSNRRDLQEMSLSAIGSVAAASEKEFLPYAEGLLSLMKPVMESQRDEDLSVRAKALELVGIVGLACGREGVERHLSQFIEAAIQGFALDHSELREYSHGFFGQMSQLLEGDFIQFLPRVVPLAISSCDMDDGTVVDFGDSDEEKTKEDGGVSSDEEEDEDEKRFRNVSVRTGVLDEKAAATQALGCYALYTKSAIKPFMEAILSILEKHAGYFHEDVRLQAMLSLQHLLTAAHEAYPPPPTGGPVILAPETSHVYKRAMELYLRAVSDDEDKDTVAQACNSISCLVKTYGRGPLEPFAKEICEAALELLKGEALCQQGEDSEEGGEGGEGGEGREGEENEEENDLEHDEVLIDSATDLLPAIAEVMGPSFEPSFRLFFPSLMKFAEASRPAEDRSMAIGCVAEVARFMGPPSSAYVDTLMPILIREIGCEDAPNRRNAAFCAGILCWNGRETALPYYGRLLMAFHPLFGEKERSEGVRDNAAGAVARMISVHPEAIPFSQVLPVLVSVLPLKEDLDEGTAVYGCICSLITANHPEVMPLISTLFPVLVHVSTSHDTSVEVRDGIFSTLVDLKLKHPVQFNTLLSSLPPSSLSPSLRTALGVL